MALRPGRLQAAITSAAAGSEGGGVASARRAQPESRRARRLGHLNRKVCGRPEPRGFACRWRTARGDQQTRQAAVVICCERNADDASTAAWCGARKEPVPVPAVGT